MQLQRLAEPVSIFPDRDVPASPRVARPGSITRGVARAAGSSLRRLGVAAIEGGQDAAAAIPTVAGQPQGLYQALALPGDVGFGEAGYRPLRDLGRELRLRSIGQPQRQRAGVLARIALREAAALAKG